jgi:tyrosinase
VYNFSRTPGAPGAVGACGNCLQQQEAKALSSGQITLTGALLACIDDAEIQLYTLDKNAVGPYLQTHLKKRVVIVRTLPLPAF